MAADEARPPGCARHSATTVSALAVSPGGSRAGGTTGTAEGAADAKSVAEIAKARRVFQSVVAGQRVLVEGTREVL